MRVLVTVALAACTYSTPVQTGEDGAPITISFLQPATNSDEKSNQLAIEVALSAPPTADAISVRVSVVGGDAMPDADFRLDTPTVTFAIGETLQIVTLTILEDTDETEAIETIELALSEPSGALLADSNTQHSVTISNLILPRLTFVQPASTTPESVPTSIELVLDTPATLDATFTLAITKATATPVDDFAITNATIVTIPAGVTSVTVPIGEVPDALDEDDEEVVFGLQDLSSNILIGSTPALSHVILDDDLEPVIGFVETGRTLDEPGGTFQLEVRLSAPSGRTVTVDFARDDAADSAIAAEATVTAGTLTFVAGEVSKLIDVTINDDLIDEDAEQVILVLSAPSNATLGTATHTTTIGDNDAEPTVFFSSGTSNDNEGDFSVLSFEIVTVTLSGASGKTITVPFTNTGTLSFPGEYSLTGSPLTFNPGQTTRFITIDWSADDTQEPDETVILTLGTPTNATLGATTVHTFTLIDND